MLLTVREVARRLRISEGAVYELVGKGKLACHRIGIGRGILRISESDLEAYLQSCRCDTPPPQPAPVTRVKLKHLRA